MRFTQSERMEIIRIVEHSDLSVAKTLRELSVARSTFYEWYRRYAERGYEGLADAPVQRSRCWNKIPEAEREKVVELALELPELTPRELAWHVTDHEGAFISESSVYRILKGFDLVASPSFVVMSASDKFQNPTRRVHELWQTDFTYFKVAGWGWYYMLSILDDYSRKIIAWKLYTSMAASDVTDLLGDAIAKTGATSPKVRHRPRLLSDNGPCFVSKELAAYLEKNEIKHTRGRPYHPMTQGKIERFHRSMKSILLLQNHYSPEQLSREIARFIDYYNHRRVHESLNNLTPEDVYQGRGREILTARQCLKLQTLENRRRINMGLKPRKENPILPSIYRSSTL